MALYPVPYHEIFHTICTPVRVALAIPRSIIGPYDCRGDQRITRGSDASQARNTTSAALLHGSVENWVFIFLFSPKLEVGKLRHGDAIADHI